MPNVGKVGKYEERYCTGHKPVVISFENRFNGYATFSACWDAIGAFLREGCHADAHPHSCDVHWSDVFDGFYGIVIVDRDALCLT